jgi:L-lactate dehydrogenase (cytochrome)
VDTSTTILGSTASLPLVLAPTGFTRMMHTEGEPAVARVAARVGIPYALSTMGTTSIERFASVAEGRWWFQLYLWRDREASRDFVVRAREAGYEALVLTVDTPIAGPRLRDVRNGLTLPPSLSLRTFAEGALHPGWWWDLLTTEPLEFASLNRFEGTVAQLAAKMFDPAATLDDVAWLRSAWDGPLVVKGIQTVADARAVVDAGADATWRRPRSRCCRRWSTPSAIGPRSTSTAASSRAPTSWPRWPSAPGRRWSVVPTSTG